MPKAKSRVRGEKLNDASQNHNVIFGTGCGKDTRLLIPDLLRMANRSVIIHDPKAEIAAAGLEKPE